MKGFNPLCEAKKAEGRDRKGFVRLCINVEEILGHNINTKTSVESYKYLHFHPLIKVTTKSQRVQVPEYCHCNSSCHS